MLATGPRPSKELSQKHGLDPGRSDDLTSWIRGAILDGTFFPNQHLVEKDMAERLGTNRATIRVCLAVLEQQGLVIREPNKGFRVRLVTAREAIEIMETRSRLESLTARDAARHATGSDVTRLRKLQDNLHALLASGDLIGFSTLNIALHGMIARISRHVTAAKILNSLHSQTVAFQFHPIATSGRTTDIDIEHANLVEAIARGDPVEAETAMQIHLDNSVEALRRAIKARPSGIQPTVKARATRPLGHPGSSEK